jgi:hypothetical protein
MRVGWGMLPYYDVEGEHIELKGHKPDVNCGGNTEKEGKDAFDVALVIGRDEGRVIGFRKLNEEVKGEIVFEDYDPKMSFDSRKAYYSKYTFPAMENLEGDNRRKAEKEKALERLKIKIEGKGCEQGKSDKTEVKRSNLGANMSNGIDSRFR